MIVKMYTIYDKKTEIHSTINPGHNDGSIVRDMQDEFEKNPRLKKYAADFAIYEVGEFDDKSGKIDVVFPPRLIIEGTSLVKTE